MRILTRFFLVRLIAKLLRGNSTVAIGSFAWFQFVACFLIFFVHTIAYLMFNLSYLVEDHNHKSLVALATLSVNLLPIHNLVVLAMRLLFNFRPKFAYNRIILEFEPKEMARSFLVQEVGVQSYYLLFVWLTRHLSIMHGAYDADLDPNFWSAFVYSSYIRVGFFVFVILDNILANFNKAKRRQVLIF